MSRAAERIAAGCLPFLAVQLAVSGHPFGKSFREDGPRRRPIPARAVVTCKRGFCHNPGLAFVFARFLARFARNGSTYEAA